MPGELIEDIPLELFVGDQKVRRRLDAELIEQISKSFVTVGQLQPARARRERGRVILVDGHHRLAAAKLAGFKTLAVIIETQELTEGDVIQRQLISCQRAGLSPLEAAHGIRALMATTGWNASQSAENLGFSNAKVTRLLALLSLPAEIIQQVESGQIAASSAYELARVTDPVQQAELAEQMAEGRLTRDAAAGARKAAKRPVKQTDGRAARATALLGKSRAITVSSPGLTMETFVVLIEELLGKARRERSRGTELSTFISLLRDQARTE
jgi:ParB family transcriptional regulator, chromosome partitioning protein